MSPQELTVTREHRLDAGPIESGCVVPSEPRYRIRTPGSFADEFNRLVRLQESGERGNRDNLRDPIPLPHFGVVVIQLQSLWVGLALIKLNLFFECAQFVPLVVYSHGSELNIWTRGQQSARLKIKKNGTHSACLASISMSVSLW